MPTNDWLRRFASLSAITLFLASILAACGGSSGSSSGQSERSVAPGPEDGSDTSDQTTDLTMTQVRERFVAWYPLGIQDNPPTRNLRNSLVENGWERFGSGFIPELLDDLKAEDRGIRRVLLHTPFGRVKPIQFDGYLEALENDRLDKVTGDFVDDWRRNVTDPALGRTIEVIGYIGSPVNDSDSQRIAENEGESAFFERAWNAVQPLLDAQMSIALDAAAPTETPSLSKARTHEWCGFIASSTLTLNHRHVALGRISSHC